MFDREVHTTMFVIILLSYFYLLLISFAFCFEVAQFIRDRKLFQSMIEKYVA